MRKKPAVQRRRKHYNAQEGPKKRNRDYRIQKRRKQASQGKGAPQPPSGIRSGRMQDSKAHEAAGNEVPAPPAPTGSSSSRPEGRPAAADPASAGDRKREPRQSRSTEAGQPTPRERRRQEQRKERRRKARSRSSTSSSPSPRRPPRSRRSSPSTSRSHRRERKSKTTKSHKKKKRRRRERRSRSSKGMEKDPCLEGSSASARAHGGRSTRRVDNPAVESSPHTVARMPVKKEHVTDEDEAPAGPTPSSSPTTEAPPEKGHLSIQEGPTKDDHLRRLYLGPKAIERVRQRYIQPPSVYARRDAETAHAENVRSETMAIMECINSLQRHRALEAAFADVARTCQQQASEASTEPEDSAREDDGPRPPEPPQETPGRTMNPTELLVGHQCSARQSPPVPGGISPVEARAHRPQEIISDRDAVPAGAPKISREAMRAMRVAVEAAETRIRPPGKRVRQATVP
jgi:hypothetical protein